MKNLKKVLALVLVVALMMGFATVAGAADFTDSADVDHTEAVEVMTAIGVINGYPDGSFRPDGNVTRAQMAKMVAYIVSGGEDVGDLYAGATAFSDCLTHWARGYIAYANTTGIIAGVGNGRFNPDGNVTGAQAAKMMLCALGYKQDTEGYTGTGWSVNVLADARTVGLLDGLNGVNMNAALNREDAAQLMFNALKATMVEYPRGNTVVNGGDGTTVIIGGSEATYVGNSVSKDYRVSGGDAYMQMCEYYFEDLELNAGSPDDFGRPANKWEYKNDAIGTYAKEADATYTATVKLKDIYSDLGLSRTTTADVIVDGKDDADATLSRSATGDLAQSGSGVLVEAYVDDDDNVSLIVINTYVGEISAVYEDADDPYSVITPTTGSPANNTFETTAFDEDDVVLYTMADGEIQSVALAEKVSDLELTSTTGNTKFVADGTTYTYNKTATKYDGNLKDSVDVYLDNYGYVVYVEKYEAGSGNYAFVLDYKQTNEGWQDSTATYEAKLLMTDGTVVTANIDDQDPRTFNKKFVSYTVDDDEIYTLYLKDYTDNQTKGISLTKGTSKFDVVLDSNYGTYYANNNTIFLVYDRDAKEYTVYTGIDNVPSMSGSDADVDVYVNAKSNGSTVAQIVYISGKSSVVSSANNALVYIIDGSESGLVKDSDRGNYYTYDAVIDGEITTIDVAENIQLKSGDVLASRLTYNSKDVVTNIAPYGNESANADDYAISGVGTKKTTDGTVGLTSGTTTYYTYSDDVVVFRIEDNDFKAASVTSIRDDNDDTWSAVVKDGEVVAIFITTVGTNTPGKDDPADANVTDIDVTKQGQLTLTLSTAVTKDTTYTVTVEQMDSGNYVTIATVKVVAKSSDGTSVSTDLSSYLAEGRTYRVTYGDLDPVVIAYSAT